VRIPRILLRFKVRIVGIKALIIIYDSIKGRLNLEENSWIAHDFKSNSHINLLSYNDLAREHQNPTF
jgi:hypothetical protein